ncbi:hypothetical protein TNCV_517091 [Trichonephila clavipes]|nr:hypothetical protein TNCV_517091 [Trichonephila clavipes]
MEKDVMREEWIYKGSERVKQEDWRFGGCCVEAPGSDKRLCFGGCWCEPLAAIRVFLEGAVVKLLPRRD